MQAALEIVITDGGFDNLNISHHFLFKRPLAVSNLDVVNCSLICRKQKSYIYVTCGLRSPLAGSSNGTWSGQSGLCTEMALAELES